MVDVLYAAVLAGLAYIVVAIVAFWIRALPLDVPGGPASRDAISLPLGPATRILARAAEPRPRTLPQMT